MDFENGPHAAAENRPLAALFDDDLLRGLNRILEESRRVESALVAHIAEVDTRRLWARGAYPSMFAYCTIGLHLSESEAYLRITAARASREHAMILPMLGDGRLHLSGIALLAPHLTRENREVLLHRAGHRSKRQIEELVAELAPRPDVPASMRKLPVRVLPAAPVLLAPVLPTPVLPAPALPAPALPALVLPAPAGRIEEPALAAARLSEIDPSTPSGMGRTVTLEPELALGGPLVPRALVLHSPATNPPTPPSVIRPLAPGRYKVQFTASAQLQTKLERLRALMRTRVPDGDLAVIIEIAVGEKLERLEARRFAATTRRPRPTGVGRLSAPGSVRPAASGVRPAASDARARSDTPPASRHVPASVRRAVRERDGDRCAYVDPAGRRCVERNRLEYHHRRPFGLGGRHEPENVCLMCRAHNVYQAEHDFGQEVMGRFRRRPGSGLSRLCSGQQPHPDPKEAAPDARAGPG